MTHWDYRVLRKEHETGDVTFHIHEVHYGEDGAIELWSVDPVEPMGESVSELREDIRYFLRAFRRPVLQQKEESGKSVLQEAYENGEINDGHYFELMDRASVALDYCSEFVGSHPVVRKNKELKQLYDKAEAALYTLYQEAAGLEFARSAGSLGKAQ